MIPVHTILVPTDLSALSLQAFDLACSLARDRGARLEVLHVAEPAETVEAVDSLRDRLYRMLKPESGVRVDWRLELGDPAAIILRVAGEVHADLIVMGACNEGGGTLGGVAERVAINSCCPVLTLTSCLAVTPVVAQAGYATAE
jgi:nucleotide-binding universal stress UspA family protein